MVSGSINQDGVGTALLVVLVTTPFAIPLLSVKARRALAAWIARFRLRRLERKQKPLDTISQCPVVSNVCIYPVKSLRAVSLETAELDSLGFVGDRRFMLVTPSPPRLAGSFYIGKESHRFVTQRQCPLLATIDAKVDSDTLKLSCSTKETSIAVDVSTRALENEPIYHAGIWDDVVDVVDVGDEVADFIQSILGHDDNYSDGIRLVAMKLPKTVNDAYVPAAARTLSGDAPQTSLNDGFPILIACEASLQELNKRLNAKGQPAIPMSRFRPNIVIKNTQPFEEDSWKAIRIGKNDETTTIFHVVKGCPRCKQSCTDQVTGEVSKEPLATLADFRALGRSNTDVYFAQNAVPQISHSKHAVSVGDVVTIITKGDPVWDQDPVQAE